MLDVIDSGKLVEASACALTLSPKGFERFYSNFDFYKKKVTVYIFLIPTKIILRPVQITNNPELITRLGVIAMNTPVEVDIYGHANSSIVNGSKIIHGIGGSGNSIFLPLTLPKVIS